MKKMKSKNQANANVFFSKFWCSILIHQQSKIANFKTKSDESTVSLIFYFMNGKIFSFHYWFSRKLKSEWEWMNEWINGRANKLGWGKEEMKTEKHILISSLPSSPVILYYCKLFTLINVDLHKSFLSLKHHNNIYFHHNIIQTLFHVSLSLSFVRSSLSILLFTQNTLYSLSHLLVAKWMINY